VLSEELSTRARKSGVRNTIRIFGQQCVYYDYPSERASTETIVMVHGYRGNHRGLEAIAAGLEKYRVVIPDLPGFGESEQLSTIHSLDAYAHWLGEFLSALGIAGSCHVVGHSFGTLVVGRYATTNLCKSIVLINPVSAPALSGPRAILTRITSGFYRLSTAVPESVGSWLLRSPVAVMVMSAVMTKSKDGRLRRWIHKQHLANFSDFASVRVASEAYSASISSDLSIMASSIRSPVLVIAAELDDLTDIATQRSVVKLYPSASIVELNGVGHLVHYEAPQEAATFIGRFIESVK